MQGSVLCQQEITVLGGVSSQIYGAGAPIEVTAPVSELKTNPAGSISSDISMPANTSYSVVSRVANDNENDLRAASNRRMYSS